MTPVRGRAGREKSRAKDRAAGIVPHLNARRTQAKARAADRDAAEQAQFEVPAAAQTSQPVSPSSGDEQRGFTIGSADEGMRLDQFLAAHLEGVSRSRVQLLIEQEKVAVSSPSGPVEVRASHKLSTGEHIRVLGHAKPRPLRAIAEDIPLDILYEDEDLAVINKPAGMMVHAGSGNEPEDERGKGTLVNALLHHLGSLSQSGEDELRPGIVHRLDKQTSGVLVVAKNDAAHAKLAKAFADREATKHYIALVQGEMKHNSGTINAPISRDVNRRTRMTTRRAAGRSAVTHWKVHERFDSPWGKFTLLDVTIETGRTHQIRVHLSSIGHPVVGDTLYGAAAELKPTPAQARSKQKPANLRLERNFLHAQRLGLPHPRTGKPMQWEAPLPPELDELLRMLRGVH